MSQVTLINMVSDGILPPHYISVLYGLLLIIRGDGTRHVDETCCKKGHIFSMSIRTSWMKLIYSGFQSSVGVHWLELFLSWEVPGWDLNHKTNTPQLFMVFSNLIKMLTRKITPSDRPRLLTNTTFLIHNHIAIGKMVVADC